MESLRDKLESVGAADTSIIHFSLFIKKESIRGSGSTFFYPLAASKKS